MSTDEQAESGAGLDAQRAAIEAYAERASLTVNQWAIDDGIRGAVAPDERPALAGALATLAKCDPGILLFAKLDRLTRRAKHWHELKERASREGWLLSAADGSVDTVTPHGKMIAGVMAQFAEYERELIGERTKAALAAKKASGTRLGRPSQVPEDIKARIAAERADGKTLAAIARGLTDDGVPTVGRRKIVAEADRPEVRPWSISSVQGVLKSIDNDRIAEQATSNQRARG